MMQGRGVLKYVNGEKKILLLVSHFTDLNFFLSGNVYSGQMRGNLRSGSGTLTIPDAPLPASEASAGQQLAALSSVTMSCEADFLSSSGGNGGSGTTERYTGDWVDDCKHGK